MAITVTLTPDHYFGGAGETVVLTAAASGLGSGESVDSYTWKKGGVEIPNSVSTTPTHTISITDAASVGDFSCTIQVDTGTGLDNYDSNTVTIVFGKPVLTPKSTPAKFSEYQQFVISADVTMPAAFTWYRYEWWIDGVHDASLDSVKAAPKSITIAEGSAADANKKYVLKAVYDTVEANALPRTLASTEFKPTFESLTSIVSAGITSDKDSGAPGDTVSITAAFDDIPAYADVQSLSWTKDGTVIPGATTGSYDLTISGSSSVGEFKCIAKVGIAAGKTVDITSPGKTITYDAPVVADPLWTVHPIPWRSTSFTPLGYWVLDEILYQKALGKDWKTDFADYKYSREVQTLIDAFNDNGECEVQDSRNGYIYKMSEI